MRDYSRIPNEMKAAQRWVGWRLEERGKVPYNPKSMGFAKSNDPSTWSDFDTAKSTMEQVGLDGIGFMMGDGWLCIDLDDHGQGLAKEAEEECDRLGCYKERSQSGKGIHYVGKGHLPEGGRRKGNVEMYDGVRFLAMTGDADWDPQRNIPDITEQVARIHARFIGGKPTQTQSAASQTQAGTVTDWRERLAKGLNSNPRMHALYMGDMSGYPSHSEADMALCSMLAFWLAGDESAMDQAFRESSLMRPKWDERRGAMAYGQATIRTAAMSCQSHYEPKETTPQWYGQKSQNGKNPPKTSTKKRYDLTDTGNAERFVDEFGAELRYDFDRKSWMHWDGERWERDDKAIAKTLADRMISEMKEELLMGDGEIDAKTAKNINRLASSAGKEAMLKEAQHMGDMPTKNEDYDSDPWLLNCKSGVIDLRTGEMIGHQRKLMCAKECGCAVDMETEPTRWLSFLDEVFGEGEMPKFIQRAVGYTLTGITKEQCFFQCYGEGANGKSVFLDVMREMLGDYAVNSQAETILQRGAGFANSANSEVARMAGARFVRTNEPNEGSRFNEGLVKQLVGGDATTARYLYGNEFEFRPMFKLWMATNYKIEVRGTDFGIWRRMKVIPFKNRFEGDKADKDLTDKLRKELPAILGWAVKGCLQWQKEGLNEPQAIKDEQTQYRKDMDILSKFAEEACNIRPEAKAKASQLYKAYADWAKEGHEFIMTQTKFGIEMSKRYPKTQTRNGAVYQGIVAKRDDTSIVYVGKEEKRDD